MAITKFKTNKQVYVDGATGAAVNPTLSLNFASRSRYPYLEVSRAGVATYINKNGYIESAIENTIRISHDPVSLECKGLLVEPSRANLLTNSNNFSSWIPMTVSIVQDQTGPDNTTSAWTITDSSAGTDDGAVFQEITITPSTTTKYCVSLFIRPGTATYLDLSIFFLGSATKGSVLRYEFATGILTSSSGDGGGVVSSVYGVRNYADGWKRIWFVVTDANSGLNNRLQVRISAAGRGMTNTGNSIIYGAQVEIGGWPTSYIPTTSSQVTRNLDLVTLSGTSFSSWFNSQEGTMIVEYEADSNESGGTGEFQALFVFNTSSYSNSHGIYCKTDATGNNGGLKVAATTYVGTTNQALIISSFDVDHTVSTRLVYGYALNNIALCYNGRIISSDLGASLPSPTAAHIGSRSGIYPFSGHIKSVTFFPKRFTDEESRILSLV